MLRWVRISMFCLLACHVAACSPLSVEDRVATCVQTDWESLGESDGRLGIAASERSDRFEECADIGRPANMAAYDAGRLRGLQSYCTAENGYRVGYEGEDYEYVCPQPLERDFLRGYNQARIERPSWGFWPNIAIGIGTGVGIGIRIFSGSFGYSSYGLRPCTIDRYCW